MSCAHSTIWGGLCVECGVDVSELEESAGGHGESAAGASSFAEQPAFPDDDVSPVNEESPELPLSPSWPSSSSSSSSSSQAALRAPGGMTGDGSRLSVLHGDHRLQVSRAEAERIHRGTTDELLRNKRLLLVLDLDNTLVHATTGSELERYRAACPQVPHDTDADFKRDGIMTFSLLPAPERYFLKLSLKDKFEFHMYTHGTRNYALKVAHLLDPEGTIFKQRVLSRDDCQGSMVKTLKRLFPVDESMALVVDDRTDVWGHADNVVNIPAYSYFYRNRPTTPPYYASERYQDNFLLHVKALLERLHSDFFARLQATGAPAAGPLPDLKHLMRHRRREVLEGTVLVFSAVFPHDADRKRQRVLKLAMQHGATWEPEVSERTTHVVSGKLGTEKVVKARRRYGSQCAVVHKAWFFDSVKLVHRQAETEYALLEEQPSGPDPAVSDQSIPLQDYSSDYASLTDDEAEDTDDDDDSEDGDSDDDDDDGGDDGGPPKAKKPKVQDIHAELAANLEAEFF